MINDVTYIYLEEHDYVNRSSIKRRSFRHRNPLHVSTYIRYACIISYTRAILRKYVLSRNNMLHPFLTLLTSL
jgi:hypothetical protein